MITEQQRQEIKEYGNEVLLNTFMDYTINYDYSSHTNDDKHEIWKELRTEVLRRMKGE